MRPRRKIIYNASLSMESTDFDAARETLMAAVEANEAWMESASVYGTESDHDRSADYTVRVPVDNYRAFLAAVGEAGSVRNVSENAENITSSYIDVLRLAWRAGGPAHPPERAGRPPRQRQIC